MQKAFTLLPAYILLLVGMLLPMQGIAGDVPSLFSSMKNRMAYSGQRQAILSKNIANANTPDYRARDLKPFGQNNMSGHGKLKMRATNSNHFSGKGEGHSKFRAIEAKNTFETTIAGNNVSLDEEMRKIAENSLEYQATTNLYKKWAGVLRSAVK